MTVDASQRHKGQDGVLSTLDVAIQDLNLAKENRDSGVTPAKDAFGSVSVLLNMIRVFRFPHFPITSLRFTSLSRSQQLTNTTTLNSD